MIRYQLDPSTTSIVGVCREPGCGFRALSSTRDGAIHARTRHEEIVHMTAAGKARRHARLMRTKSHSAT